jgi:peptidoglycan/xylan/chitin deacetylase (PgdA/CDA1 family)
MYEWREVYRRPARPMARRLARARRRLPTTQRSVALTFDDGPDPASTPAILDTLAEHHVPATFFLLGERSERHPGLVERILSFGHEIGSHSASHLDPLHHREAAVKDVSLGRAMVEQVAGRPIPMFRPPYGELSLPIARAARACSMATWLWSLDPDDWVPEADARSITEACCGLGAGDVVLLHDSVADRANDAKAQTATLAALPSIIARARRAGLTFVALPSE